MVRLLVPHGVFSYNLPLKSANNELILR